MIRIAAVTLIAATVAASDAGARTETPDLTGMLASILGDGIDWEVGARAMEGGREVYRNVLGRGDGISIELQTARRGLPPDDAWLYLTGIRMAATGEPVIAIKRLAVDVPQLERWTGAEAGTSSLCLQPASGDVAVLANGLNGTSEEGRAGFRALEATVQLVAGPAGQSPCTLSASLDFGGLEMWRRNDRVDIGGGRITLDLDPGREGSGSLSFSATQLLVSRLHDKDAAPAPDRTLAVGTVNGELGVSPLWARRLLASLSGRGGGDMADLWQRLEPVGKFHLEALNADLEPARLFGEAREQSYRTATGKKAVAASARAVGQFHGTHLRARVQVYLPGIMDVTLLTTLGRVLEEEPEVVEADLLYRDIGLAMLLDVLKIGSAAELLTGPLIGLVPEDSDVKRASLDELLQPALERAAPWMEQARSRRMQASIRPGRPVPLYSLILMIAQAPEAAARSLGLMHGPHAS